MANVDDNISIFRSSVYSALSETALSMPDFTSRVDPQPTRITESAKLEVEFILVELNNVMQKYQRMDEVVDRLIFTDSPEYEMGPLLASAAAIKQV